MTLPDAAAPVPRAAYFVSDSTGVTAETLGNTPSVARSSYIDPRVFDRYRRGILLDTTVSPESAIRTLILT